MADHYEGQTGWHSDFTPTPTQAIENLFNSFKYESVRPFNRSMDEGKADFMTLIAFVCEQQLVPVLDTELFSWGFIDLMEDIGADVSIIPRDQYEEVAYDFIITGPDEDFKTVDNFKYNGGYVDETGTYCQFGYDGMTHELPTDGYICAIRY